MTMTRSDKHSARQRLKLNVKRWVIRQIEKTRLTLIDVGVSHIFLLVNLSSFIT